MWFASFSLFLYAAQRQKAIQNVGQASWWPPALKPGSSWQAVARQWRLTSKDWSFTGDEYTVVQGFPTDWHHHIGECVRYSPSSRDLACEMLQDANISLSSTGPLKNVF